MTRLAPPDDSCRRWRARRGRDRGSTSIEIAVGMPMLVLLLGFAVQVTLWGLADLAARNAANHAAQTTRVVGGTAELGHADAAAVLQQAGGSFLHNATIHVDKTAETTTVTIHGSAPSIIPGLRLGIDATVTVPTERYRP